MSECNGEQGKKRKEYDIYLNNSFMTELKVSLSFYYYAWYNKLFNNEKKYSRGIQNEKIRRLHHRHNLPTFGN